MTQLALFQPTDKPPILPDRLWYAVKTEPGRTIRVLKIKSFDGKSATVCPANFVDEAWPHFGRTISEEVLRRDWRPMRARKESR
jgi:hypothetical protein